MAEQVVYLIEQAESGHTKIGVSVNPRGRMAQLQYANPCDLILRYTLKSASGHSAIVLEGQLHRYFSHWRGHGEWFKLSADAIVQRLDKELLAPSVYVAKHSSIEPHPEIESPMGPEPARYGSNWFFWAMLLCWVLTSYAVVRYIFEPEALTTLEAVELSALYLCVSLSAMLGAYFEGGYFSAKFVWGEANRKIHEMLQAGRTDN
jgi:hypothetical protein